MNTVGLAKVAAIQRSVGRAREEYIAAGSGFRDDFTRPDAAILNILRACEAALDLANLLIRARKLGIPQAARDSFRLLADAGVIERDLADRMQRMIGFRNIAVHHYQPLDLAIVESVLGRDLDELLRYSRTLAMLD